MVSLRENLTKIGEPYPGKLIPAVPHGFHSFPKNPVSLRKIIHSMTSPELDKWSVRYEDKFFNHEWTQDCQGITTDGSNWFVVSNNKRHRAIHKFGLDWSHIGDVVYPFTDIVLFDPLPEDKSHIGDPDYYEDKIYVPVEDSKAARVWVLDTNLNHLGRFDLGGPIKPPQKAKMPWLAINPWNGFLYSSIFGDAGSEPVTRLYAYDLKNFEHVENNDIILKNGFLHKVQGGCFSDNGHVFLTSDDTHAIHAYSSLNGHYYGSCGVPSDWSGGEEMEGVAVYPITRTGDIDSVFVHVIVLDVDEPDKDDVYFKHFSVPRPEVL